MSSIYKDDYLITGRNLKPGMVVCSAENHINMFLLVVDVGDSGLEYPHPEMDYVGMFLCNRSTPPKGEDTWPTCVAIDPDEEFVLVRESLDYFTVEAAFRETFVEEVSRDLFV